MAVFAWPPNTDHMSMTVTFTSARPASNAAANPEIPAPTMTRSAFGGGAATKVGQMALPIRAVINAVTQVGFMDYGVLDLLSLTLVACWNVATFCFHSVAWAGLPQAS